MIQNSLHFLLIHVAQALLMAVAMFREMAWTLVLGLMISALLQELVSRPAIAAQLGRASPRSVILASLAGAASSSCSYAATAITRTLFRGGAALIPALAFLLASTNLVVELGIVLYVLLGWRFMAAEWLGSWVLVAVMAGLVSLTYPARLVADARAREGADEGADNAARQAPGDRLMLRLARRDSWIAIAQHFTMDVRMLWKDVAIGLLLAGALASFVPAGWWASLFARAATPWLRVPLDALIGPLVAMLSFVCSIGNVPLAAVLWGSGVGFGGVLAFLFADLLVLPVLDAYRRAFGWRLAAYIAAIFYVTMVVSSLLVEGAFTLLGWTPHRAAAAAMVPMGFGLDGTFWADLVMLAAALVLVRLSRQRTPASCCGHHR